MSNPTRSRRVTINYQDQKVYSYPSPRYATLIKAYADVNEISESEAGQMAIKTFIDSLPVEQKNKIQAAVERARPKNTY